MSEDIYGQPFGPEIRFGLCDRCNVETPMWMITREDDNNQTIVSFLCNRCHEVSSGGISGVAQQVNLEEEEGARPAWMEEFISEQRDNLQAIGDEEINNAYDSLEELGEVNTYTEEDKEHKKVAKWSISFVQEALFGADPKGWLEKQGAYNNIDETIHTLENLTENQTGAVKLSAMKCLEPILHTGSAEQKQRVHTIISNLTEDTDETVMMLAKSML